MEKNSVIGSYFKYQDDATSTYGSKSIVFMEVGSFYEAYQTDELGVDLSEISKLINVIRTRKNGKDIAINIKNPYMLGFPVTAISDRLKILTDNGYSVVIVGEVTKPPQKVVRKIIETFTPGTNIISYSPESKYIMAIFIKEEKMTKNVIKHVFSSGITISDISTGYIASQEFYSSSSDDMSCIGSINCIISSFQPCEILVHIDSSKKIFDYIEPLSATIRIVDSLNPHYFKLGYQTELIGKVYADHGLLHPIEYIGMTKCTYAIISLIMLLDYINRLNPGILQKLNVPESVISTNVLYMGNNAAEQLNILNSSGDTYTGKIKSLFDVVNHTLTPMGMRYMKKRLSAPLTDDNELSCAYDIVECLINGSAYQKYEAPLKNMGDIEKIYRKMLVNCATPKDIHTFINSIAAVNSLIDIAKMHPPNKKEVRDLETYLYGLFSVNNLNSDMEIFYNKCVHPELDNMYLNLNDRIQFIDKLKDVLSALIGKPNSVVTKETRREGFYYTTTKARRKLLIDGLKNKTTIDVGACKINVSNIQFEESGGSVKIIINDLDKYSDEIVELKHSISRTVKELMANDIKTIIDKFDTLIRNIIKYVAELDFHISNAKSAVEFGYIRPRIVMADMGYVECKQMRHPIIERIIAHQYVGHDLSIGKNMSGMLLYGLNSSGKSSMMKALGICVIMAQSGMFVPASSFVYSPYKSVYTRISGNDNIFKELSSFSVEMMELRTIWKHSNNKTLIIGDEVCRGTEQLSGTSIVAATIIKLAKLRSSFIFATHLHDVAGIKKIAELPNVKVFHLSVKYDETSDKLVFDRKLCDGVGEKIYGITVAKYIMRDNEFMDSVNEIKSELLDGVDSNILIPKTSRYNANVYMDACAMCGKKQSLDSHHILQQKEYTGGNANVLPIAKNATCNLVVLCKQCHNNIHKNKIKINGYVATSSGKSLLIDDFQ